MSFEGLLREIMQVASEVNSALKKYELLFVANELS